MARELRNSSSEGQYRLRRSGMLVQVRHPLLDMWVLDEVFRLRVYEPPHEAAVPLRALDRPLRIVDLGANVGYFGVFAQELFPESSILAFEPDPDNARLLSNCIAANDLQDRWSVVQACAAISDGTLDFESSGPLSRASAPSDPALGDVQTRISGVFPFLEGRPLLTPRRVRVASRDVFPFLAGADLVKVDIEGGEWELLADPRFAGVEATAIVLEYHPPYGPGDAAESVLRSAFAEAGYEIGEPVRDEDAGVVWAWKRAQP